MARSTLINKATIKYYSLEMFKLMLKRGIYSAVYTTVDGVVLNCTFDADEWHVVIDYVTDDMHPVSVVQPVLKSWA